MVALGVLLLVAGATGAGLASKQLPRVGYGRFVPVAVAPFGAMIGGGAALARGYDVAGTMVAGAVLVPMFAMVARLVEVRRRRGG